MYLIFRKKKYFINTYMLLIPCNSECERKNFKPLPKTLQLTKNCHLDIFLSDHNYLTYKLHTHWLMLNFTQGIEKLM